MYLHTYVRIYFRKMHAAYICHPFSTCRGRLDSCKFFSRLPALSIRFFAISAGLKGNASPPSLCLRPSRFSFATISIIRLRHLLFAAQRKSYSYVIPDCDDKFRLAPPHPPPSKFQRSLAQRLRGLDVVPDSVCALNHRVSPPPSIFFERFTFLCAVWPVNWSAATATLAPLPVPFVYFSRPPSSPAPFGRRCLLELCGDCCGCGCVLSARSRPLIIRSSRAAFSSSSLYTFLSSI
ncbi:hypothetical protein V9T40_012197 [Parthenolecanium corni]|uniref:Uncharacterized protein n=1 Tax=Parthenolecanium corni TaxID=536013 RepID=A0AAN9XYV7_9HEMI